MATNQDMELFCFVSYSFEVVHCHSSSVDILVCKCSSGALIRWLRIRTWNCCWSGFVPHSSEAFHCHSSCVGNLGCKWISSPLIRWLRIRTWNCCWSGFGPYSLEDFHCHPTSVGNLGSKCISSIDKMATNQDMELLLEWICPLVVRGFPLPCVFCCLFSS